MNFDELKDLYTKLDSQQVKETNNMKLSDTAKVKLLFTQTRYDQSNMWTECREVEVDLPDWITERYDNFEWHITGMIKQED